MTTEPAVTTPTETLWREGRPSPLASLRLGVRRALRGWSLLLALGLGMLVTVVLICAVPLYTTLVPNVELQHILATSAPVNTNFEVQVSFQPYTATAASACRQPRRRARPAVSQLLRPHRLELLRAEHQPAHRLRQRPNAPQRRHAAAAQRHPRPADDLRLHRRAAPHADPLRARPAMTPPPASPYEILVTPQLGLAVGDLMQIGNPAVALKVVGVWQPKDPNDPFWNLRTFDVETSATDGGPAPTYPAAALPRRLPEPPSRCRQSPIGQRQSVLRHHPPLPLFHPTQRHLHRQPRRRRPNVQKYRHAADTALLQGRGGLLTTQLDTELAGLVREVSLLAQPLYVVVALVVGLALLFIAVIGGLLVEGQAGEIATLKSRGASVPQFLSNVAVQSVALASSPPSRDPSSPSSQPRHRPHLRPRRRLARQWPRPQLPRRPRLAEPGDPARRHRRAARRGRAALRRLASHPARRARLPPRAGPRERHLLLAALLPRPRPRRPLHRRLPRARAVRRPRRPRAARPAGRPGQTSSNSPPRRCCCWRAR